MGFEVIHQPKSNAVFFFREIPWQKCLFFSILFRVSVSVLFRVFPCSSVANSSASSFPTVAHASNSEVHFLIAP
jgi:hypothetical protein